MSKTPKQCLCLSMLVGMMAVGQNADALTIFASVGGAPTGVNLLNFDDLILGYTAGQTTNGPNGSSAQVLMTPDALAVQGFLDGKYAAPFLSGGNGAGFGSPDQPNGVDTTTYLTAGRDAKVELLFTSPQQYLGLLWGSVDAYNTLLFYNNGDLVDTVTGSMVLASPNGDQGVSGTVYANVNTTNPFNRVVFTSSEYAFEFDNVAYSATPVPDGGTTLMLLGLALSGMGLVRRKIR